MLAIDFTWHNPHKLFLSVTDLFFLKKETPCLQWLGNWIGKGIRAKLVQLFIFLDFLLELVWKFKEMRLRVQLRAESSPISAIWGDEGWKKWKRIKGVDKRECCWYWVLCIGPYSPMVWPHSVTSSFNSARNLSIFSIDTLILMLVRSWTSINFHWNDS